MFVAVVGFAFVALFVTAGLPANGGLLTTAGATTLTTAMVIGGLAGGLRSWPQYVLLAVAIAAAGLVILTALALTLLFLDPIH